MKTETFDTRLTAFVDSCQMLINDHDRMYNKKSPVRSNLSVSEGDDGLVKIVRTSVFKSSNKPCLGESAFAFIDRKSGNVYRPRSFYQPVKTPTSNVWNSKFGIQLTNNYGMIKHE